MSILMVIFYTSAILGLIFTLLAMVFANIYDIKAARRVVAQRAHPYAKWRRYRPLVTVFIAAYNEAAVIERCLKSISASHYRRFEVIVVDDGSSDATAQIVNDFIVAHPKKTIRLIRKLTNGGKGAAIATGYRRFGRGDLVMTLDADCVVEPTSISRVVRYFADPKVAAVAPNVRILPDQTVLGLLQRMEFLIGFRSKKFFSASNCEYIVGGAGGTYRKSVFGKVRRFAANMKTEDIAISLAIANLGNKANRIVYAADAVVRTEAAPNYRSLLRQRYRWKFGALQAIYANRFLVFNPRAKYSKMLSWFRLPIALWSEFMLLTELLFFSLFMLRAVLNHNPALYVGAYIMMIIILLISIWADDHFKPSEKLTLSLATPIAYPLFLIMTSIQVMSAFKCVLNFRGITRKVEVDGRWRSPDRRLATHTLVQGA